MSFRVFIITFTCFNLYENHFCLQITVNICFSHLITQGSYCFRSTAYVLIYLYTVNTQLPDTVSRYSVLLYNVVVRDWCCSNLSTLLMQSSPAGIYCTTQNIYLFVLITLINSVVHRICRLTCRY